MAIDSGAVWHTNLTSYVGRTDEGVEVRRLLGAHRLVTLTGPGGVGKTRLAGQTADACARAFPDGVVAIGLAELRDDRLVARVVADRLGLRDSSSRPAVDTVLAYLRDRRLLLVLDNCEHLVDSCAELVGALLRACRGVVVLATSRSSLGVAGEHVMAVPPLPVPPEDTRSTREALTFDAVRLLVDRATSVLPAFRVTDDNAAHLVRLCRQLDGLPLAIELAAARIRILSPKQIADRVAESLSLLATSVRAAPERHRTLRATVDWSHSLCDDTERAVWARCSVFAGPFDLAAAEDVCAIGSPGLDGDQVLAAVDGLVDKSVLLRAEGRGTARYQMLEVLRDHGRERLAESGEETAVARTHRDRYDRMIRQAEAEWFGPEQDEWLARLRAEHADLRAALSWSVRTPGEGQAALRMATCLVEYWMARGAPREVRDWIDRALAAVGQDAPGRARALAIAALCAALHSDLPTARARLASAEAIGDEDAVPYLAHAGGFVAMLAVEPRAVEQAALAVRVFGERGDVRRQLHPMFIQGVSMAYRGDLDGARGLLRTMRELCESADDRRYRSMALFGTAVVEVSFGDVDIAETALRDALRIDLGGPDLLSAAYRVDGLAWVAARREDHRQAAVLFGTAAALWDRCGAEPDVAVAVPHRLFVDLTRTALGAAEYDRAFADGRTMAPGDALGPADAAPPRPAPGAPLAPLTRRESEIAELVTAGLTNREIASRLVIAQRTAETHIQHILNKLDFVNRTQVAAWVVARRRVDT